MSPYLIEQRVRREERARLPREGAQHTEERRRESHRSSPAQQARICLVQLKSVEAHSYWIRVSGGSRVLGMVRHLDPTGFREASADDNSQSCAATARHGGKDRRHRHFNTERGGGANVEVMRMRR